MQILTVAAIVPMLTNLFDVTHGSSKYTYLCDSSRIYQFSNALVNEKVKNEKYVQSL